jgi:predicted transcriptional regulator
MGHLETMVMDRLWTYDGPATVRQVLEDLHPDRPIAYTTVMTVMDNLHTKSLVTREMVGRAYAYQPTQTREQYNASLMGEILSASRDPTSTLLRFLEQMPASQVAQLRQALRNGASRPRRVGHL